MATIKQYTLFKNLCQEFELLEYQLASASDREELLRVGARVGTCADKCLLLAETITPAYELLEDYRSLQRQFLKRKDGQRAKLSNSRKGVWVILITVALALTGCNNQNFNLHRSGNSYTRTYQWPYDNHNYQLTFSAPMKTYWHYVLKPHVPLAQWNTFVLEDPGYPYLASIDKKLCDLAAAQHMNDQEFAQFVLAFVQNMHYAQHFEPFQIESPKYPVVSLLQGMKDCKDGSILYTSLMSSMNKNYKLKLFALPGHMAAGISGFPNQTPFYKENGISYVYAETTSPSQIGAVPRDITPDQLERALAVNQTTHFNRDSNPRMLANGKTKQPAKSTPNYIVYSRATCKNGNNSRTTVHIIHLKYSLTIKNI